MNRLAPYSFLQFLEDVLRLEPSPGQRALWSVMADGVQPAELEGEAREAARHLFGDVDEIPLELLAVAVIVKGARIGGSYLGALRILDLALAVPLEDLAPGEEAFGVIVAPDLRLAQQTFRYVTGAVDAVPALKDREVGRTATSITIVRDDRHLVTIECLPASRGGSALRGRTLVGALLDEAAFFRDDSYIVNDVELYKAVAPRVVPGGQVLISSTPWAETGLLYDLFTANHGHPRTAVAVHAPTRLMRSDASHILRMVDREEERDPENAAREYGAGFMAAGSGLFFDVAAIDQASEEYSLPLPARGRVAVAVDPGFTRDAATFAAVALEEDGTVRALCLDELRPAKGQPLKPSVVIEHWAGLAKGYGVRELGSDVHYRETVREHMGTHGIALAPLPEGQTGKRAQYDKARSLLNEGRLRLPRHKRLLAQMREVIAKPTPGGGMTISSPRKKGGHGDLVSALVGAIYRLETAHREYAYEGVPRWAYRDEDDDGLATWFRHGAL